MAKLLSDIIKSIDYELVQGDLEIAVSAIEIDSRQVRSNSVFVAIEGSTTDGHKYIDHAIGLGASVVVVSKTSAVPATVTVLKVLDTRRASAMMAHEFFNQPSKKLILVGITGTNGKTSVAFLSHQLFSRLGFKVGLISTIEIRIGNEIFSSALTTPDQVSLQRQFATMIDAGCTHVFMEVSSHALHQERIAGSHFSVGVFTNITHDHLDYHGTFDEYIRVKKSFFDTLGSQASAIINMDDRHGSIMAQNTKATLHSYALQRAAKFKGKILANDANGLHLIIDGIEVYTQLVGVFNASNLLAVYSIAVTLGQEKYRVLQKMSELQAPPGRFQVFHNAPMKVTGLVDYAHTPDALKKVLEAINDIKGKDDQVITVIGCGGNRDALKRPKMAEIACRYSDRVVLTSDNPRDEEPSSIIKDMEKGIPKGREAEVISIVNREEAIKTACLLGRNNAIILIAGKGHETYQEIMGERKPFDDREILKACLN